MPAPQDALNYAKRMCGNMPVDDVNLNPRVLDDASRMLWMVAPWRWTIQPLEVITLSNNAQDYALASHTDLLFLVQASLTDGVQRSELQVTANLPSTSVLTGKPTRVSFVPPTSAGKLRTLPVPSQLIAPIPSILAWYKQLAPTINAGNQLNQYNTITQTTGGGGSNVGFPDEFFWVYREAVLLYAYQFTHDARLGAVQVEKAEDPKQRTMSAVPSPDVAPVVTITYTGQYAVVQDGIQQMRVAEKKFFDSLGFEVL